jgi:hypothetical protein
MRRTTLEGLAATLAALIIIGLAPPAPPVSDPTERSGCRAADSTRMRQVRRHFARPRATTPASRATLVTRPSICAAAAEALNALFEEPGVRRQVWVYQLGDDYAVEDPDAGDERGTLFVFDRRFAYRRTLVGF